MTGTHRRNDPCRSASDHDGSSTERFCGTLRNESHSQALARAVKVRADQQRLPSSENVFSKSIVSFALSPWKWTVLLELELKRDGITFLECHVEIRGVKYLS